MNDYSSVLVILMGLGTVFFGLICLIALTTLMGHIMARFVSAPAAPAAVPMAAPAPVHAPEPNRNEIAAAISAAIAENLGEEITGIRILSMKKL